MTDLHINYESAEPFGLTRKDEGGTLNKKKSSVENQNELFSAENSAFAAKPVTNLRADKENAAIIIDSITILTGVPSEAWEYKLGNRSALEWILDQYKEKTPQDATIREKFNTYKFADYKEQVIDLLKKITTVSVRTMQIVRQMPDL